MSDTIICPCSYLCLYIYPFNNKTTYSYNVYHQLADNTAGAGARGARWARVNNIPIHFIPPK
mgnify:CR=1 FL=1